MGRNRGLQAVPRIEDELGSGRALDPCVHHKTVCSRPNRGLVTGVVYALLGTTRQLAVGPTSALAIVIASSVVCLAGDDPSRCIAVASAIALMVGMVCIAGRFVGLANAAYFISDPVLIGFKTGAAL